MTTPSNDINRLVFGKDPTECVVGLEVHDSHAELFLETPAGIQTKVIPNKHWLLSTDRLDEDFMRLHGNLHYRWVKVYDDLTDYYIDKKRFSKKDTFSLSDSKEATMISRGITYFKGMKVQDVSVLGFDIESISLLDNPKKKILLISNTFRKNGQITRKLFAYDDYPDEATLIAAWCSWVREINPSIVVGHNIFMYDFPYLQQCAENAGLSGLALGRDGSNLRFNRWTSKFRFDGSQDYDYTRCNIYGREIVDTMFLSMKYDAVKRQYENYKLKYIINKENLEVPNRQFYDAEQIRFRYTDPDEWVKIKQYAIHDADDALALYDLMIPSYFYYTQSIPKPFQSVMYSASGSQINSFLMRSYLQEIHSLPKTSPEEDFIGAISMGNPGSYKHVYKVDVASLYPSIMLQYEVYDHEKDPKGNFQKMVAYFTEERLRNKKLSKETGDRYYENLEQAQKIVINSAYGMLGASGLLFNSPKNAAFVTTKGREILQTAIDWAVDNGYKIVNADTDSISICNGGMSPILETERKKILSDINSLYPNLIRFEDDGMYEAVLVIKAKNYVLEKGVYFDPKKDKPGSKRKFKGSALKSSKIERALKEFMVKAVNHLLDNDVTGLQNTYKQYVKEIFTLQDISRWTSKKTITEKVLASERTTERKILNALNGESAQMGDKIYVYFDKEGNLKQEMNWTGDHDTRKLCEKLYKTICIFENVLDLTQFTKYHLKGKMVQAELKDLLNETKIL